MGEHKLSEKSNKTWTRGKPVKLERALLCRKCGKPLGIKGSYPAVKITEGVYEHAKH